MSCHASVLVGGHVPHPPHNHVEEGLLIPLHGEVESPFRAVPPTPHRGRSGSGPDRSSTTRPGSIHDPEPRHHAGRLRDVQWHAPLAGAAKPLGVDVLRSKTSPRPQVRRF
jgi:hypothetical protein